MIFAMDPSGIADKMERLSRIKIATNFFEKKKMYLSKTLSEWKGYCLDKYYT